jgi:hypothetical protein
MYKLLNNRKSEKVDMPDISLSFAVKECPQTVMREILNTWRCTVREPYRGISVIEGLPFPAQIIENTRIAKEHSAFLKMLDINLGSEELEFVLKE